MGFAIVVIVVVTILMAALLRRATKKSGDRRRAAPERVGCATAWARLLEDADAPVAIAPHYETGAAQYDPADLVLIDGLLARGECDALIAAAEAETFGSTGFPRQYRGNLRLITTDASLADALWARLRPLVPATVTHKGATWDAYGCNERLRVARYETGDLFASHLDADYRRGDGDGSMFTVNIYLNDVVDGGRTRFEGGERGRDRPVRLAVEPRAGRAVVFAQPSAGRYLYHDGEPLGSGRKYLLRTDVMYRRRGGAAEPAARSDDEVARLYGLAPGA